METLYEKKVKDIMIPIYDYPTVSSEATLKDAVLVLMNSYAQNNKPRTGRQCVLIVENYDLVGTFGIPELLNAIEPQHMKGTVHGGMKERNAWVVPIFWDGLFTERCREVSGKKVKDYMRPIENHIDVKDTLLRAAYHMVKNNADYVAVNDNGRLVGMIRSVDLFQEVTNLIVHSGSENFNHDVYPAPWSSDLALNRSTG